MKTYYINRLDKYFDGYHILSAKDENGYYVWVSLGDNEKILFDEFSKIFREEQLKEDVLANEQLIAWLLYPFEFFKNEYRQKRDRISRICLEHYIKYSKRIGYVIF